MNMNAAPPVPCPAPADHARSREWLAALASFLLALGFIIAMTWPWALHLRGEMLPHWDPPFHAWKLEFMARHVLAGDIFFASDNTNILYPYSGALYFEALQWPQALFAAVFFGLTSMPSELVYHITLLFFWALSAPCMYFFLRQLDCRRIPSMIGALIFCILPHRMSYMVEFQMEMIFPLPLFFAFIVRFFKERRPLDAILAAASCWLFAVTELYEAIFAVMTVPFIVASYLSRDPRPFATRRFWLSAGAAVAVGLALANILLPPYARLHAAGNVLRSVKEVHMHAAELFSYVMPYGRFYPWKFDARKAEFSLYPTVPVLLLCLVGALWWLGRESSCWKRRPHIPLVGYATLACGITFIVIGGLMQFRLMPPTHPRLDLWETFGKALLFGSLIYTLLHTKAETPRATFLKGLFAAAVFFLFLSFGPKMSLGDTRLIAWQWNHIYYFCYEKLLPFLSGFRVVSRFAVFILFFMVCMATATLDAFTAMPQFRGRSGRDAILLCLLVVAGVALEGIPKPKILTKMRRVDKPYNYPTIKRLAEEHPNVTLAICPCLNRSAESMKMFTLIKGDWPYVFGWGGFFPGQSDRLSKLICSPDPYPAQKELSKFYPPCLLIFDKRKVRPPVRRTADIPEDRLVWNKDHLVLDYDKVFADIADLIDSDKRFSLFKLKSLPPAPEVERIFRSDIALANPLLSCVVSAPDGTEVVASLNGRELARAKAAEGQAAFSLELSPDNLTRVPYNTFSVVSSNAVPISVESFELANRSGVYRDVFAPYASLQKEAN